MKRQQQGVALITAVMVVAFASTVGAALMVQQNLAVHRSANLLQQDQAWWYSVGLAQWGATLMDRDREDNQFDHFGEAWAQAVDFLPVDEGVLAGQLLDLQGRFNLRSLLKNGQVDAARKAQLLRLLNNLKELKPSQSEDVANAIIDWMDSNTEPSFPGGAEDGIYLAKQSPYRAANLPIASVSELRLVEGITAKIYAELVPLLTVHPGDHKININTASAPVLLSLSDKISPAQVDTLLERQTNAPFETDEQAVADTALAGTGITIEDITVKSQYFQADTIASIGNVQLSFSSMLERPESGKTRVIAQNRNNL